MRSITKQGTGGHNLRQSHIKPPVTPQQATSRWSSFAHKPHIQQCLLDEQYQLCCYSELRADEEGLGHHIEHLENKSQNPKRTFDYSNLAACALDSTDDLQAFKAQGSEVFGGHAAGKRQAVDVTRFISCQQLDCRRFFSYLSDGRVVPAEKLLVQDVARADYTITLLNLNSPYLITRRRQWWDELDLLFQEHQNKGWHLPDLVSIDLVPNQQRLSRFFSLTRQFFGTVSEHTLQEQAPQLF